MVSAVLGVSDRIDRVGLLAEGQRGSGGDQIGTVNSQARRIRGCSSTKPAFRTGLRPRPSCGASAETAMAAHPGPFTFLDIAYALARLPGRLEVDRDEAGRILDDITERYANGDFAEDEIMVQVAPHQLQPLKTVLENAQGRGELGPSLEEIRVGGILSHAAAKRYVQASGLTGAARLLAEWFEPSPEAGASVRTPSKTRRKPGPKADLREGIIEKIFGDLSSGRRTPEQLKGDTLAALATHYGGSLNTAGNARKAALIKFAEFQKPNSEIYSEDSER